MFTGEMLLGEMEVMVQVVRRCSGALWFVVWGLGFVVWGLGFGVWGLGFGVWGLGFGACVTTAAHAAAARDRGVPFINVLTGISFEAIHEIHHPRRPRHGADAAAARHERGEPSVQPPHATPALLLHAPPPVNHGAARNSAHAQQRNLRGSASHGGKQRAIGSARWIDSHRCAAAAMGSVQQRLQGLVYRV